MRRTSADERARLHQTFAALCRIPSPTGAERECADWVARELRSFGLEVEEDAGPPGAATGNLFATVPPEGDGEFVLLCTHLDTVPPLAAVEPVQTGGGWQNANHGILGADNKAAVAVAIELARRLTRSRRDVGAAAAGRPRAGVELLFTVAEETGLQGARAFDPGRLRSRYGYVLDHASPIGEIITESPTYHRIVAEMAGRAAHAGLTPELGRNAIAATARGVAAMRLGRLDPQTTANIGLISGGSAANVVAESCRLEAEVRSLDESRAEAVVTELVDHLQDAANASECDLDVIVERVFTGFRATRREPAVLCAERALAECGYAPRHISTGGGSDANALRAAGFACLNLANGTERAHQPDERVSNQALEDMLEVMLALLEQVDRTAGATAGETADGGESRW